jgi:zinc protease
LVACAHVHDGSEPFRQQPPAGAGELALQLPSATRTSLGNGLSVVALTQRNLPLVHARVVIRSGSAADPGDIPGLAGFLAEMLEAGTPGRSATEVAAAVENLGSSLSVSADTDTVQVSFTCMTEHFAAILAVVADVVRNPAFAEDELVRVRERQLAELAQALANPGSMAARRFRERVYPGPHPYAHTTLGSDAGIRAVSGESLRSFHQRYFRPQNAAVVVVGDVETEAAVAAMQEQFGTWADDFPGGAQGSNRPWHEDDHMLLQPRAIDLVHKAGAPQSQLRIGHVSVSRHHAEYFNLVIMNAILGGVFNSRINMNLREDKGYTYGARSYFDFALLQGPFVVYAGVRTDATAAAIREVLKEIDTIRSADVSEAELTQAKNAYTLSLPGYFQSISGIAGMLASLYLFDLPLDYFQTLPEKLRAVTVADVRRVAQSFLHPESLQIVVVGDRDKVQTDLAALDYGGTPL